MGLPLWTAELDVRRAVVEQLRRSRWMASDFDQELATVGAILERTRRRVWDEGYPGWLRDGRDADAIMFVRALARLVCVMTTLSSGD